MRAPVFWRRTILADFHHVILGADTYEVRARPRQRKDVVLACDIPAEQQAALHVEYDYLHGARGRAQAINSDFTARHG